MAVEQINIADNDEWLALRRTVVSASETPLVLGLARFGSLAKMYARKKGLVPVEEDNAAMRRGRWREATVFQALTEERPHWDVVRAKIYLRDPVLGIGATPDGFALRPDKMGRGVVEAKSISRTEFRERWLDDAEDSVQHGQATCPIYYRLQTLQTMMLANTSWGVVAVVIEDDWGAYGLRLFDVERDDDYERMIIDAVTAFRINHLLPGIPPPYDREQDADLVKAAFRHDDGTVIDLSTNNRVPHLADRLTQLRANKREDDKEAEAIKTELLMLVENATYAKLADGRVLRFRTISKQPYTVEPKPYRDIRFVKAKELPQEAAA